MSSLISRLDKVSTAIPVQLNCLVSLGACSARALVATIVQAGAPHMPVEPVLRLPLLTQHDLRECQRAAQFCTHLT
jgi:hypothetical protein